MHGTRKFCLRGLPGVFSSQISSHKDSLELELLPAVNMKCSRYTGLQHSNRSVNVFFAMNFFWEHLHITVLKEALLQVFGIQGI